MNRNRRMIAATLAVGVTSLVGVAVIAPTSALAAPAATVTASATQQQPGGIQYLGDTLTSGQRLLPGQGLRSTDGISTLIVTQDAIAYYQGSFMRWEMNANRMEMGTDGMVLTFKVNADQSVTNIKKQQDTAGWGDTLRVESQRGGVMIRSKDKKSRSAYQLGINEYYFGQ